MNSTHNDIFRFVSVRGSQRVFTVDPTEDIPDAQVPRLLRDVDVDVDQPNPTIARLLRNVGTLSAGDLSGLDIASAAAELDAANVGTLGDLRGLQLAAFSGNGTTVEEVAAAPAFKQEYRGIADSWLKLKLTDPTAGSIPRHEEFVRVAHLIHMSLNDPFTLGEPDAIPRLRVAQIVLPQEWAPSHGRIKELRNRHRRVLAASGAGGASDRAKARVEAEKKYQELMHRRELMESIQDKADRIYLKWKRDKVAASPRPVATTVRQPGWLGRVFTSLGGPSNSRRPRAGQPLLKLDTDFFTELDSSLTVEEQALYTLAIGSFPRPDTHADHDVGLAPEQWISEANLTCHQIELWEAAELEDLPDAPAPKTRERPLVRAIGWGELVVARERLIGYEAREIAHIENVMSGEAKVRRHERQRTVEQVIETETLEETESERDLQTTDRFELQSEAQTTINEDYSIQAGLNTSGRYGLTKVDTSLQAGLQVSKSEARSSSQTLAREVVSKSVERTFERVRELRRQTITEQIRELNRHSLQNLPPESGGAPIDISGIYLWVEKLLEVELRHYGTRMLVEFHIPEPAVSLLERGAAAGPRPRKPAPFTLSPSDVMPENYMCLTSAYGAQDVAPPPAKYIRVGYSWATTPNEEIGSEGQEVRADYIAIPLEYRPVDMTALISAHPNGASNTDVFMAIGGEVVVEILGADYGESGQAPGADPNVGGPVEVDFDPALPWSATGVPVVVRAAYQWDNTLVAEATIRCKRTAQALDDWRLRTWEQLRAAHELLMQTYRTEVEEQALATFAGPPLERPDAENRRIEAEELRKWAIKAMRGEKNRFDAIRTEDDGLQEIDPTEADILPVVAGFFEEAFEWPQASYFLYPYYWGRRDTWRLRAGLDAVDARHSAFLRAGAARFIVPVTPGYEDRVTFYLAPDSPADEQLRLEGPPDNFASADSVFANLWQEILLERRPELGLGSGTLNVTNNSKSVTINADSNWQATQRDIGRSLFIDGDEYSVESIVSPQKIKLDEVYRGVNEPKAIYATGSVPYGPPWIARVPTSLVVLNGRRPDLAQLSV